jgi:hypothetical protein
MTTQLHPSPETGTAEAVKHHTHADDQDEITIYSHSPILYWWPVWLLGFAIAVITILDGGQMAYVPAGTRAEGHTLVAPTGSDPLDEPHERMARSHYLGTWFFITLLVVFVSANVQLRGLWEWIVLLGLGLLVTVVSLYGLWGLVFRWFNLLHIRMNLAGYVFVSLWMFVIWVVTVFVFDRRTYLIFAAGQVRILDQIGAAERVYDVTNLSFQVQPNVFFRHRVLGFYGAGDLVIRTGGPQSEVIEWPNVLFVRSRVKQIQHLLKSREVV